MWVIRSPCFILCYSLFLRVPRVGFLLAVEKYECIFLLVHHCDGVYIHLDIVSRTFLGREDRTAVLTQIFKGKVNKQGRGGSIGLWYKRFNAPPYTSE